MMTIQQETTDYGRIATAIEYVEQNADSQPSLKEIADHVGLSEFHFQRLFTRWVGISPKRFLQFLTVQHAKHLLAQSRSVLDAAYDSGLSGPGRLHDLFVNLEAMTPGEYKRQGAGLVIRYGFHESPFGLLMLAVTDRGICNLLFVNDRTQDALVD
ncbi:MAG: helix-turn-helix transcriptional regulator, partial [Chloroflexi bacterium]|nr:helix-turn-helix transcriptional regulator [Chloroflexota bacterium]